MSTDDAFRRFMAAATAQPRPSCIEIMEDHRDEWLERAAHLAEMSPGGRADEAAALWANRLCAALRSADRLERMSAELALRVVHLRFAGDRHGSHDA